MCVCAYVHVHVHVHMCVCMCVCARVRACACLHTERERIEERALEVKQEIVENKVKTRRQLVTARVLCVRVGVSVRRWLHKHIHT